jgi:hypothetical protein
VASLSREEIAEIVGAAIRAPSILNTQPWLFVVGGSQMDLYADTARMLPACDPDGRATVISCGAALMNVRLALAYHGRTCTVALLPTPADATHLATIAFGVPHVPTDTERGLARAIPLRHTSRLPFSARPLSQDEREPLAHAARDEAAHLHFLTGVEVPFVLQTARLADRAQRDDQAVRQEVHRWLSRPEGSADGISPRALGPGPRRTLAPVRDYFMGEGPPGRPTADFETSPTLAVLYTSGDNAPDWLVAGQALQRVLLAATTSGLASSLLTQPLEVPDLRRLLTHPSDGSLVPQALIRLGFGPPGPKSARRPVSAVLSFT